MALAAADTYVVVLALPDMMAGVGLGQYAVSSIQNSDFSAVQGFVIVAAIFNLAVYLIVDLLYFAVDPRLRAR